VTAVVAPPIETEKLSKHYGSARGITDVDLVVERGEIFGFLGPNGAGKTTLIRTLLDFLRPTSGVARVLGLDSRRDSLEIRRRVSYLAGDLALYDRLTSRQQLDWLAELNGGVEPGIIGSLADRFQLDLDRPIRQLSKGNRQKVGLVQAFMHRADLLILDEPTGGLDPLMQHEFQRLVREEAAEGRTVFLSSHVLDEVQHLTHRVGIIREGKMVAVESVDTLRRRAVREIEVRFAQPLVPDGLDRVPGVQSLRLDDDGHAVHLAFEGPIDPLLKALAHHEVVDLVTNPVDLDEVFLSFYEAQPREPTHGG
jgi:ABC-2 type transport system ATP-binding protein